MLYPPAAVPSSRPLKFGILGAANIAPIALVRPVKNHPDAVVYAVAARDKSRADDFAKMWGVEKAYGSYQGTTALTCVNTYWSGSQRKRMNRALGRPCGRCDL